MSLPHSIADLAFHSQRIDRLMLVAKELVGENYIVYGLRDRRHRREEADDERRWLGEDTPRDSMDSMV